MSRAARVLAPLLAIFLATTGSLASLGMTEGASLGMTEGARPASGQTAAAAKPGRSKPPALGPVRALKLPPVQKLQLGNGLPVLLVESHEVPVVQVNVVLRAGAGADPLDKPGLASLAADMLDEGAGSSSALQISDEVDFLGAELEAVAGWDATTVGLQVPVKRLERALAILADVVRRPTFPAAELDRLRKERLTELLQARDEPSAIASVALARALYGDKHRYGTMTLGTEASVRRFSRDDLTGFHARVFRSTNVVVVVVGDVTAARVQPLLEKAFGGWKAEGSFASSVPAAPQMRNREIWIVDRPGAAQSEIRIGRIGPPRSTADYYALTVMNTILGGSFTSRLMQNLREQHGYAYGARSSFDYRLSTGPFVASAAVQTDKTGPSLTEFFKELDAIGKTVTEAEVAKAKNYVALSFPSEVETTGDLAAKLQEQFVYGLPDGYFDAYVSRIGAVTLADVLRVAREAVDPKRVMVVVVGDRKKIEADVRGLKLGPARFLSVNEVFGAAR